VALTTQNSGLPLETVPIDRLKIHPRNYRQHPPDQLLHIVRSIEEHGVYRNVVVAVDYTILAGHGVVKALTQMGRAEVTVFRLPVAPDSVQALKLLAGDNEIGHLAEVDDRLFTEILKEVKDLGELLGTGYDELMLANLIYVTRPESEIKDLDEAAAWAEAGMPEFGNGALPFKLVISFRSEADRVEFTDKYELRILKREAATWATWWPYREPEDASALRFEPAAKEADMKVRALTELTYGDDNYNPGDVFLATPEHARELIDQGIAESADTPDND
jgi:hypothetical protein